MKLTTEQLLKIAQTRLEEIKKVKPSQKNDVLQFINEWNIKEGKHKVTSSLIYQSYKSWTRRPKSKQSFLIFFSKAFESKMIGSKRCYLLNYRPVELLNKIDNAKVSIK